MKTLLNKIRNLLNPPSRPTRQWVPDQYLSLRVAELKPGDTLVVSFPQITHGFPESEAASIEADVRKEIKVPEGVHLAIFFSPVDFYHLRKV